MMVKPIVFLGPSLAIEEARETLDADYRPPIQRGGMEIPESSTVAIIDGLFHQALSVSPMEIRRCLDRGCRVFGCSSIGAQRAVELEPFGMTGVGWVFEAYRDGRVLGDDEVALALHPKTYRAMTVALVDIRWWLETAVTSHGLPSADARRALRDQRRIYFADRVRPLVLNTLESSLGSEQYQRLRQMIGPLPDIKAQDARKLLSILKFQLHNNTHEKEKINA